MTKFLIITKSTRSETNEVVIVNENENKVIVLKENGNENKKIIAIAKKGTGYLYSSVPVDYDLPVKEIKVAAESRSQGWITWPDGQSFSWGELVILSKEGKEKGRIRAYENKESGDKFELHKIVINDSDFLGKIRQGDSVALCLRSEWSRWKNYAKHGGIELVFETKILEIPRDLWCTADGCQGVRNCVHADDYGECDSECEHKCAECNEKTLAYIHSENNDSEDQKERTKVVWEQIKKQTEENQVSIQTAAIEVKNK